MTVIATSGSTVTVYRFKTYDGVSDEFVTSTRHATEKTIESISAVRFGGVVRVPAEHVDGDGFTSKHYVPIAS